MYRPFHRYLTFPAALLGAWTLPAQQLPEAPPAAPPPFLFPEGSAEDDTAALLAESEAQVSMLSMTHLAEGVDPNDVVGIIRLPDVGTQEVLAQLEQLTGKAILRQQNLPAVRITFFSQSEMTREEAILAIDSLLSLNGIAILPVGDKFLKAVPSATASLQVPPLFTGSTLTAQPSQQVFAKVFRLQFLNAQEAQAVIQPMLTQGAPILAARSNLLLVTDALINLQRIELLIEEVDAPPPLTSVPLYFQMENALVDEVLGSLRELQQGSLAARLEGNTTYFADERSNQLIVFTHEANRSLIEDLVERLDVDVAPLTRTEIYDIQYAEASEVAALIDEVITGQKEVRDDQEESVRRGQRQIQQQTQPQGNVQVQTRTQNTALQDAQNLQFSDFLTLTADERANTILASGTPSDHLSLADLISKIDVLLAQVKIEVVIVDVTLSEDDGRGIDRLGLSWNQTADGGPGPVDQNGNDFSIDPFTVGRGLAVGTITGGPTQGFSIDAVLGIAANDSDVSVLSAPTIVTTHNREASITVGQQRPFVSSSVSDATATSTTALRSNIDFRDIVLELTVRPLIGKNGVIQLEITQVIDTLLETINIEGGGEQPVIGTRSANSFVSVMNNELVVLGGLQSIEESDSRSETSVLRHIPILGQYLFTRKLTSETRSELLIFIRPTVVENTTAANEVANKQLEVINDSERVYDYLETGSFRQEKEAEAEEEEEEETPRLRRGQTF